MGIGVIVDAFVVVVIGGLGSIGGSMAGSLIVGAAQRGARSICRRRPW
jgi:branched-subunit amino acid ABC-type transport system permease component